MNYTWDSIINNKKSTEQRIFKIQKTTEQSDSLDRKFSVSVEDLSQNFVWKVSDSEFNL